MNHNYSAKLNLDLKLFKSDLHPVDFLKKLIFKDVDECNTNITNVHFRFPNKFVSDELKEFFRKHNQCLGFVEIFYIYPNSILNIHTDQHELGSFGKINWVFTGNDSQMIWYDPKDSSVAGVNIKSEIDTPATSYKAEDLNFKYAEHLEGPNLVEVGCPHTVATKDEERWCVSTIFTNGYTKNQYKRPTMEESLEIFKDYL